MPGWDGLSWRSGLLLACAREDDGPAEVMYFPGTEETAQVSAPMKRQKRSEVEERHRFPWSVGKRAAAGGAAGGEAVVGADFRLIDH